MQVGVTCRENFVKFGRVVFKILCELTHDALTAIFRTASGRGGVKKLVTQKIRSGLTDQWLTRADTMLPHVGLCFVVDC